MEAFYVTVVKNPKPSMADQVAFAIGPCATHEEAIDWLDSAVEWCRGYFPDGHWWAYGTTRVIAKADFPLPAGKLNEVLGYKPSVAYPVG